MKQTMITSIDGLAGSTKTFYIKGIGYEHVKLPTPAVCIANLLLMSDHIKYCVSVKFINNSENITSSSTVNFYYFIVPHPQFI